MRKQAWTSLGVLLVGVAVAVGCSSEPPLPKVDCTMVTTVPTYSQLTIFEVCTKCHSTELTGAARHDADGDINYNTYAEAKKEPESAARQVNGGKMPPTDNLGDLQLRAITDAEKTALYQWALCGTPQ